jgi:hypothetical protein
MPCGQRLHCPQRSIQGAAACRLPATTRLAAAALQPSPAHPTLCPLPAYLPPAPACALPRRYAFLLFRHRDNHLLQMQRPAKRISFQTRQWAKERNMGDPVAALYCYANHGAE